MLIDKDAQSKSPTIEIDQPESGITALGVSSFVASGNQSSAFDIGMGIAGAIPNSDVSQTVGAINIEPPRLYRRVIYLSQAAMPDRFKLS